MLDFERVIGSQQEKPKEIDTESSSYFVYIRKNIKEYTEQDEEGNILFNGWQYDEAKILNSDYTAEELARQKEEIETLKEDNLILMECLTDLAELILEV